MVISAQELKRRKQFQQAFSHVTASAVPRHPCLAAELEQLDALRNELLELRQTHESTIDETLHVVRDCIARGDFPGAHQHLAVIRSSDDREDIRDLALEVDSHIEQIADASKRLKEAIAAKKLTGLMSVVAILRRLDACNERWLTLEKDLAQRQIKVAIDAWKLGNYTNVVRLLSEIPNEYRDEQTQGLLDQANELELIMRELKLSPYVDRYLMAVVKRLKSHTQLRGDAVSACEHALKKLAALKHEGNAVRWSQLKQPHYFDVPVCGVENTGPLSVQRLIQTPEGRAVSTRLFAACGLALQSMGIAAVQTNLLVTAPSGLRARWSKLLRRGSRGPELSDTGWGIDIGASALRAVKLRRITSGGIEIERWHVVETGRAAGDGVSGKGDREDFQRRLQQLLEMMEVDDEPVTVGLSGIDILHRILVLPHTTRDKLEVAVRYESKHQIPFDLSEVQWDYHVFHPDPSEVGTTPKESPSASGVSARNGLHACLIASKQWRIDDIMAGFREQEVKVQALQSNCLAIHNWARFITPPQDVLTCLDIGLDSTDLVYAARDRCWMRSWGNGMKDVHMALVRELRLTHDQAWEIVRDPGQARQFFPLIKTVENVYRTWEREIRLSLNSLTQSLAPALPNSVVVLGGGRNAPGLMRYFTTGPLVS